MSNLKKTTSEGNLHVEHQDEGTLKISTSDDTEWCFKDSKEDFVREDVLGLPSKWPSTSNVMCPSLSTSVVDGVRRVSSFSDESLIGSENSTRSQDTYLPSSPKNYCPCKVPITLEPALFMLFFTFSFTGSATTLFLEEKVCFEDFNKTVFNCSMPYDQITEEIIQDGTSRLVFYVMLVRFIPSFLLSTFIGTWSDSNGRKPFLLIPVAAYSFSYIVWIIFSRFPNIHYLLYIVPSTLADFFGGSSSLFICSLSYIGDVTTPQTRGLRYTILSSFMSLGLVSGNLASTYVYTTLSEEFKYVVIFGIASFICLLNFFYILLFVSETIQPTQLRENLNTFQYIMKMYKTVLLQQRPSYGRARIILIAFVSVGILIIVEGEFQIKFLSLKRMFLFNLADYNTFTATLTIITAVVSLIGMALFKSLCHLSDVTITIMCLLSWFTSYILIYVSKTPYQYYAASSLGIFSTLVSPALKSELSKVVEPHNIGKVFAFNGSMESLFTIGASLYPFLYGYLIHYSPFTIYLLSALIVLFMLVLAIVMRVLDCVSTFEYRLLEPSGLEQEL